MRWIAVVAIAAGLAGCGLDPNRRYRPSRMQFGANARQVSIPSASASTARGNSTQSDADIQRGVTGAFQFTQLFLHRTVYVGVEAEAGALGQRGSNFAAGYGVLGAQLVAPYGSIAAELAGGYRSVRLGLDDESLGAGVLEPRVRGYVWLSPQLSLGATAGANVGDRAVMAGFYLGVHSEPFDTYAAAPR